MDQIFADIRKILDQATISDGVRPEPLRVVKPELYEMLGRLERKLIQLKAQNSAFLLIGGQQPTINVYYDVPPEPPILPHVPTHPLAGSEDSTVRVQKPRGGEFNPQPEIRQ